MLSSFCLYYFTWYQSLLDLFSFSRHLFYSPKYCKQTTFSLNFYLFIHLNWIDICIHCPKFNINFHRPLLWLGARIYFMHVRMIPEIKRPKIPNHQYSKLVFAFQSLTIECCWSWNAKLIRVEEKKLPSHHWQYVRMKTDLSKLMLKFHLFWIFPNQK